MQYHFRHLKLGLPSRLIAVGFLYAGTVAVQIASGSTIVGLPLIAVAWFLLALKGTTNKPKDQGLEEWRAVTDGEVARIADSIARSKKLRASLVGKMILSVFFVLAMVFVYFIFLVADSRMSLLILDAGLFLIPGLFFGSVKAHVPPELDMKLSSFVAAMDVPRPQGFVLTPYLRFDKDDQNRDVPEDLRLMLEPRRKPEDLVGIQFQVSINKGANGNVPYMYAVVLTKGRNGPSHAAFKTLKARGFEVEAGGNDEYGTVVIRQVTEGGGYHTTGKDCSSLMSMMLKALGGNESAA
ncbi:MAG: hypothetical protein RBT62_05135 [Spirochaetia bacterium]|jgi:hypothetical protein|nr:hypothetical protein [Spirochaetia bacterium]